MLFRCISSELNIADWGNFKEMAFLYMNMFVVFLHFSVAVLAVIGGYPSASYPFYVVVTNQNRLCGGTITAQHSVVTAYNKNEQQWANKEDMKAIRGNFSRPNAWGEKKYSCQLYKFHLSYELSSLKKFDAYDIAVIRLNEELEIDLSTDQKPMLQPCPFDPQKKTKYNYAAVIGLGLTNQKPDQLPNQVIEADLVKIEKCSQYDVRDGFVAAFQICYSVPGRAAACHCDLGGPLLFKKEGKALGFIGISIYNAETCKNLEFPSVLTPVQVLQDWMKKQLIKFRLGE